jgi:hypothetical protein
MSDLKNAQLGLAKLEAQVDDAGLHIIDGPSIIPNADANDHEIYGTLDGTHQLDIRHSMLNDTDVLAFNLVGGEHFNFTILNFHPQTWDPTRTTTVNWDGTHDLLDLTWTFAGVSTVAEAHAAEHFQTITNADGIHHDVVETIGAAGDTTTVHGTITFLGLGDFLQAELQAHPEFHAITWGSHDHISFVV